ncbi:hypothetical protein PPROV_000545300 [Pycnococcus provasolii]|uniref:Uncharacterized protein n=1 Tax=Pycnococcus provasolii TaxID=41880 RepID=A0A830HIM9_9CHLO|nr:hypothetical protein PPROV_000545300 [Pycnococcus provasolii]
MPRPDLTQAHTSQVKRHIIALAVANQDDDERIRGWANQLAAHARARCANQGEGSSSMRAAAARRTFDEKVEHALSHNASTWETEMDAEQFADSVNRIELAVENLTLALAEEEKLR